LDELRGLACLQAVAADELERLIDLCTFRAFLAHETIIHERDQDACIYLVLDGSVRLTLHDKEGHEVIIGMLKRGDCFGGGALYGDYFRRTGAAAESACYLLQVGLDALRPLLSGIPTLNQALRRIYLQRLAEATLARVPLFNHLATAERADLIRLLKPHHYPRGSIVVEQNAPGTALYLIESGQVVVERDGQTIASIDEGNFFGEMSLLMDQPHSATVRTITPADMLALPAADFHRMLEQRPDLEMHFHNLIEQRRTSYHLLQNDQERARQLALSVQHGLLRGSHLLVRTPELCPPGCRICELACIRRHGEQRLHLNGATIGNRDILDACRQCRVGAECVEACPEHAFAWNDQGALFITDACTGCGECVPACPYDAVVSVPRHQPQQHSLLHKVRGSLHSIAPSIIALEPVPHYTHRADKCDLCHGHADMVCITACPTGSLRFVPVEEILPL
jgi:CRP-like cAMP-binding protein/Fe-S-cluster-containing hydrogenase component 2